MANIPARPGEGHTMNDILAFLMDSWASILIGSLPCLACLLCAVGCQSWRRGLALGLALIAGGIFAFEIYSKTQDGNLTGLFWVFSLPVIVVGLILVLVFEYNATHFSDAEKPQES